MSKKRSAGLILIVAYKSFIASLMAVTAIAIFFALENHQLLEDFSESYLLESKLTLINFLLHKVLNLSPRTLKIGSLVALLYSGITVLEAVGLWHEKTWAEILVILLIGISIPFEILELTHGITMIKLIVFLINISVLIYLCQSFLKKCKINLF